MVPCVCSGAPGAAQAGGWARRPARPAATMKRCSAPATRLASPGAGQFQVTSSASSLSWRAGGGRLAGAAWHLAVQIGAPPAARP